MVVCKFFLQGGCKFGNNCRNEHPGAGRFGSGNRFGALANSGGPNDAARTSTLYSASRPEDIRDDLTEGKGKPNWILSAYGPGKNPPASLLESNEFSPEEVRVRFYEFASNGKQDEADREAIALWNKAQQAINDVKNDADSVKRFMDEAHKKEPNRYILCKMDGSKPRDQVIASQPSPSTSGAQSTLNPFDKRAISTFGQASGPSPFGGTSSQPASSSGQPTGTSPFGLGTFGKPPLGGPGLGQPSFGSAGFGGQIQSNPFAAPTASSAFGQKSPAFGSATSTFGQASQPTSTFGQASQPTSTFGQTSQTISTFGQPSTSTSNFGQPQSSSTFGQASQPASAFGKPQSTSMFGQPTQSSAFGQTAQSTSAFSQPTQSSAFGSKTTFGQAPQSTSTFSQPRDSSGASEHATLSSAFSQPSQPSGPVFGQQSFGKPTASGFGAGTGTTGVGIFGQQNTTSGNSFGVQAPHAASPLSKEADMDATGSRPVSRDNPFGKASAPQSVFGTNSPQPSPAAIASSSATPPPPGEKPAKVPITYTHTLPNVPPQFDGEGRIASFRGQRVVWVEDPIAYVYGEPQPVTYSPCYNRPDGKGLERIWFPKGNNEPGVTELARKMEDLEAPTDEYTEEVMGEYKYLHENGRFKDGKMPRVAPKREFVDCDF